VEDRTLDAFSLTRRLSQDECAGGVHAHIVVDDALDERHGCAGAGRVEFAGRVTVLLHLHVDVYFGE
jgi:hypothetical protein